MGFLARGAPGVTVRPVRVVPPDPAWAGRFAAEASRIRKALADVDVAVHHIGSTAIRGIVAKPIVDLLLEVRGLAALDARTAAMTALGYEAMGEFGLPGRRYFRRNSPEGVRLFHAHAFERGSAEARRHLAFRDYMNAHPVAAQDYGALKQRLAREFADDMQAYIDGKDAFVKTHEALALAWWPGPGAGG
ncbi:MAG: GrpB family protein [Rubrivivax sp.]|nr:GrpB family protein [Rubrivivax sp.]